MDGFIKQLVQEAQKAGGALANNPLVKAATSGSTPIHAKTNGAVSNSPQAQNFASSPVGDVIQGKFQDIPKDFQSTAQDEKQQFLQNPAAMATVDLGGLPPIKNTESVILDAKGNPVSSQPQVEPQNGGKYVNEAPADLTGGTPAKVKAKAPGEIKFKYIPPEIPTSDLPGLTPLNTQSTGLPPIGSEHDPMANSSATLTQPEKPTQPGLNPFQKVAQKANGLSKYQLPSSYGGARIPLENQDKSVMQNVIGGNTAQQVLEKIPEAQNKVWSQVEAKAGEHPVVSTNDKVLPFIKDRLNNLVNEGIITQPHADAALQGEIKNLTQNGADINGDATITGNQLVDLRKGANAVNPKKIPYGSSNPIPYIRQAIAKGYSDAMGHLDPEINKLYQQYSSIKRIGQMPDSFRNQKLGGTIPFTGTSIPGVSQVIEGARRGTAAGLSGDPRVLIPLGIAAGAGGTLATEEALKNPNNNLLNTINGVTNNGQNNSGNPNDNNDINNTNNKTHSNGSISNSNTPVKYTDIPTDVTQIKPNAEGQYTIATPLSIIGKDNSPLAMTEDDYTSQKAQLQKDLGTLDVKYNPQLSAQKEAQLQQLETKHNLSVQATGGYNNAMTAANAVSTAQELLKDAPPDLLRNNPTIQQLATVFNGKYAKLAQQIQILQKFYPVMTGSVLNSASPDIAQGVLGQISNQIAQNYYQGINTLTGNVPGVPTQPQSTGLPGPVNGALPGIKQGSFGNAVSF